MADTWQALTDLTGGRPFLIVRVRLADAEIAIEGEFELPLLARLDAADQIFVAAFVRCHGSIKQMEEYFGVSYPTIKARLNRIGEQLQVVAINTPSDREDVLERLERGEITPVQAIDLLEKGEGKDGK